MANNKALLNEKARLQTEKVEIQNRLESSQNCPPSNNAVLVDIFAVDNKTTLFIEEEYEKGAKTGFAETHTICLWKRTNTQIMIIDPSNSDFSKRLESRVQFLLQQLMPNINCYIVEHSGKKFYKLPENTTPITISEKNKVYKIQNKNEKNKKLH